MRKSNYSFIEGEILLIDKPLEWTSFDVVNKLRGMIKRKLKVKKLKVGHAGTLDPLATGLLVICTGKKTKDIGKFLTEEKTYTGIIRLGISTPSHDLETDVSDSMSVEEISEEDIFHAAKALEGEIIQVPPVFSAKRVDGERAYKKARKGEEVHLEGKKVWIDTFKITDINMPDVHFEIKCSKGTYIRSIARDLGKSLNNLGTLTELRRTHSGTFNVQNALTISEFEAILNDLPNPVSIC